MFNINAVQGFARIAVIRYEFSAESPPKIYLLIFGLLSQLKHKGVARHVLGFAFLASEKPTNNKGKPKAWKKPTIKDRPDDNSHKISK